MMETDETPRDVADLPKFGVGQRVCVHATPPSRRIVATGDVTEIQATLIGTYVYRIKGRPGYIEEGRLSPERAVTR